MSSGKTLQMLLVWCYALIIGYVSLVDDSSPENIVPDLNSFGIVDLDKIAHAAAYALFVWLALSIFRSPKAAIISCILIAIYSLILELMQELVPSRETSLSDFLANVVGILLGAILIQWWSKLRPNKKISS